MSTINHITDQTFESKVSNSSTPVLVDFYADWCGPCRALAPMLEEIASEANGEFIVSKLDIDTNNGTAETYEVHSIPTLILFKDGEPVERFVGIVPKEHVLDRIREHTSRPEEIAAN